VHHRPLGHTGIQASEVGLGCWQLGGDFGPVDDATAVAILDAALAAGIDFWDTADVYGAGLSEQRIGNFLAGRDAAVTLATKVGRGGELFPRGYSRAAMRASLQASAARLGVECLDLAQLHCVPTEVLRDGEVLEWMAGFRDEGLVRAFGASVETLDEARLAMHHPQLASLQLIFNLFRHDAAWSVFDEAAARGVGIIVRLPLASGVLGGTMQPGQVFAASDHRHYNREGRAFSQGETFSGLPFAFALERVEELRAVLPQGLSMAQFAMRWILDHPAVSTVITGASRPGQVIENARVSGLAELPDELHALLAEWYLERVRPAIVVPV